MKIQQADKTNIYQYKKKKNNIQRYIENIQRKERFRIYYIRYQQWQNELKYQFAPQWFSK